MKEKYTNQIFVNKEDYQNEFKFDICWVIEELNKLPFDFYISGGVIYKFFFKEHARFVKDIDIVTKCDLKEVESAFRKHFNVVKFQSAPISYLYFLETFMCLIDVNGKIVQIDGIRLDFFNEIKHFIYKINDLSFKGVSIEYLISTKIDAVTNETENPFKHLVDTYTASLADSSFIDKKEIKRYLVILNTQNNKVRKEFKKSEIPIKFNIEHNKIFTGPEFLPTLQAGYNVSKETMIEEVNKWLLTF